MFFHFFFSQTFHKIHLNFEVDWLLALYEHCSPFCLGFYFVVLFIRLTHRTMRRRIYTHRAGDHREQLLFVVRFLEQCRKRPLNSKR